jgi:hypothetical protein
MDIITNHPIITGITIFLVIVGIWIRKSAKNAVEMPEGFDPDYPNNEDWLNRSN